MNTRFFSYGAKVIIPGILATLKMLSISFILSLVLGILLGSVLVFVHPEKGLNPNKIVYKILDIIMGFIRSFPVIILIVAMTPITKAIVGTSIGSNAAIIPITFATIPLVAKSIENVLMEVDYNIILACRSFGASNYRILFHALFPESMPSIVSSMTLIAIICLSTTAVAGAIGAGGLGSVALNFGYQRFDDVVMYAIVIILAIIVTLIQVIGNLVYRKISKY